MAVLGALGDLVLALSADTAKFQSDLGRAQREADKFSREVGRALGNVAGALLALGGAAGFGGLVKGQIDAADAAGKMGQKLGLATEELSGYLIAARLANVSNDQLQTGFQQMAKNQAEFVSGAGEAAAAFEAIGVSQAQMKALGGDTAKIFDLVAGKLATFEDGANKTAITMKIFGRSGAELIPLINEFERTRKVAELFNALIDKDTAAAAERFNDNLTMMGVGVQALGLSIARDTLPVLEQVTEAFVVAARETGHFSAAGQVAKAVLQTIAVLGSEVAFIFRMLGGEIGVWGAQLGAIARGDFKQFSEISKEWTRDAAQARIELDAWQARLMGVGEAAQKTGESIDKKLKAPTLAAADAAKKAADEYKEFSAAIMRAHEDAANAALADQEIEKRAGEATEKRMDDAARYAQALADFREGRLGEEEQLATRIKTVGDETKKADDVGRRFGMTFSSAFERATISGGKFSDILRGLASDVMQLILRMTITEPMARGIQSTFGGANFGSLFGAGSTSTPAIQNGGFALAEGGPVRAGEMHLVGERGPELFVPGSSGNVVPNGGFGGVTVVNNINVAPGGVTAAEVRYALAISQRQTLAAVDERYRR